MNVFLAGGSGAIGRRLIPKLLNAGHHVTATSRTEEGIDNIRRLGGMAAQCDVFDLQTLRKTVLQAEPEVLIHQLTAIPERMNPRRSSRDLKATNRLRTEGTRNLMEAAKLAGVRRFVAQSIAFVHKTTGKEFKTEQDPLDLEAPSSYLPMIQTVADLESMVTQDESLEGVVLRYGFFYGPGTHFAPGGSFFSDVERRRVPIAGKGTGVFSFIHIDDAADATVASLGGCEPGIYHIVDDDPAPVSTWLPFLAAEMRSPQPFRIPHWLVRLVAGPYGVYLMETQQGISNAMAKAKLGWIPEHSSWRDGFHELLKSHTPSDY